ncbi:hypothetical protein LC087_19285 (plasmid) [Bacillus carboniphilus]|uniref:Uncharacterized protein n=1 Tax=Bacillus carboniphilus TaxID=86663 RepID=A0ABY9JYQ1_9BACI|nr:hypothetical protein [Bacillus carboniphilus]WLR44512.1 hypothetical protein LC087_19285 [Bacillus carboniphilus]
MNQIENDAKTLLEFARSEGWTDHDLLNALELIRDRERYNTKRNQYYVEVSG